MRTAGIHNGADLRARSEAELVSRNSARSAGHYFKIARGEDEREVSPDRPYKSIGAEETFATDLSSPEAMLEALRPIAEQVAERMAAADLFGRTVTLKIKHHDFTVHTRQHTLTDPVHSAEELMQLVRWLLHTPEPPGRPVRLLGLTASNFARSSTAAAPVQLRLGSQISHFPRRFLARPGVSLPRSSAFRASAPRREAAARARSSASSRRRPSSTARAVDKPRRMPTMLCQGTSGCAFFVSCDT